MGGLLAVAVRCGKMLVYVVVRLRFQIWRDNVERNAAGALLQRAVGLFGAFQGKRSAPRTGR